MNRLITGIGAGITTLGVTAALAFAASPVTVGTYDGNLFHDEVLTTETITIDVAKEDGEKFVDKVVVDQSTTKGCAKTTIKKDAPIEKKDGEFKFKSVLKGPVAVHAMVVKGTWQTAGVVSGKIATVVCDGEDRSYTAYDEL